MHKFKIVKQNNDYLIVDSCGVIQAHCLTRQAAQDIVTAQELDNDRQAVESAYNAAQESKALMAEFLSEFC